MSFVLASFLKDLSRWRQEGSSFLVWLAIPFLLGGLITLVMDGNNGGGPSATLLIDDQDDTLLSGFVVGAFSQGQLGELLSVQQVSDVEGSETIIAGDASALLTIPTGFQDAFLNEAPVMLVLKTNPAQTILPGIIEDVTEVILDAGFYVQAMFGNEIRRVQDQVGGQTPSNAFVSAIAVGINEKMESLAPMLANPPFDLEIVEPPPTAPRPDIGLLFLPGIVLMALLFSAQGLSGDYWKERSSGTLRRLASSPGRLSGFVVGKALAAAVVLLLITGTTMLVGFLYHDIAWSKFLPSMLWVVTAGIGFFAWFAAIQMLFSTQKGASLLTTIMLFPLLMIGGSFFPLDTLPHWLASIGRLSPNGFIADRLTSELTSSSAWTFDAAAWSIVLSMTIVGLGLCSWRLSCGFARQV